MGATALSTKAKFFVALGDNFYETGAINDTASTWTDKYKSIYVHPGTFLPWYVILGNHDYYSPGRAQAQIDYYKNKRDSRWYCPDHNYTLSWQVGEQTLQIIFIDTVRLAPNVSNVNILTPYKTWQEQDLQIKQHLDWFKAQLEASSAHYLIVCGHYNRKKQQKNLTKTLFNYFLFAVWTINFDGDPGLTALIVPLMVYYNVNAYFNGHVHNLQVSFIISSPVRLSKIIKFIYYAAYYLARRILHYEWESIR